MINIIDASSLIFRAYYGISRILTTPEGLNIGAVYGFISMLLPIIENKKKEDVFICVFDYSRKSFRQDIYKAYKANRKEVPEDLISQIKLIKDAVDNFGMKSICMEGVEADDVISSITNIKNINQKIKIISSDKDLMQLVNDNVFLYDSMKNKEIHSKEVIDKFGVNPEQVIDVQALMGDSSDNIPGVSGIGPKTASDLIQKFGNLENLYENIDNVNSNRIKRLLLENKNNAFISKQLARLKNDIDLPKDILTPFVINKNIINFVQNVLYSNSLYKRISKLFDAETNQEKLIDDESIVFNNITNYFSFYPVLDSKNNIEAYYISIDNTKIYFFKYSDYIQKKINKIFLDKNIIKISIDIKKIFHIFLDLGFDIYNYVNFHDIKIMSYILNINSNDNFTETNKFIDLYNYYINQIKIGFNTEEFVSVFQSNNLFNINKLDYGFDTEKLYKLDSSLIFPLIQMEETGVLIDKNKIIDLSNFINEKILFLEKSIFEFSKEEFNIASPKQLGYILYEKLGLPKQKSTDADSLNELILLHPVIDLILKWRTLSKLQGTYLKPLYNYAYIDNRIRTTYIQTATNTGRFSSINPNIQNIPIKTEYGQQIRKCFKAKDKYILIAIDYSQIQLRLLSELANITFFKNIFINNQDIHSLTAKKIFRVKEVSSELRRISKTINFSIIYGISAFGLAKELNISNIKAQEIIDSYFKEIPEISNYIEKIKYFVMKNGFVFTPFGRKIMFDISNKKAKQHILRAAINAPIQGFEADIMRLAISSIYNEIKEDKDISMIMQIHDEIVFECLEDKAEYYANKLQLLMENIVDLSIPLKTECIISKTWG